MRKDFTNVFLSIAILLQVLHILRGSKLEFVIDGQFPYFLYYITTFLLTICLVGYLYKVIRNFRTNHTKKH